jgi:SAM-dependent methyltransferase
MIEIVESDSARRCPACDSAAARDAGLKNDYPILSCLGCGTIYAARLPPPDYSYVDYYEVDNLSVPDAIVRRIEEIVAGFGAYRAHNRLLDVGFGAGSYVSAAAKAGWSVSGVEVSKPAFAQARAAGHDVFFGQLHEGHYPENYFDVVLAIEVLEHLGQPRDFVLEVARVLRPGGLFWATTPHGRGLSYRLLGVKWSTVSPPEHLQLFSRKGIQVLLTNAGFQRVELSTHGLNPAELIYALRSRIKLFAGPKTGDNQREGPRRVASAYRINTALMKSHQRRWAKRITNSLLNTVRCGDNLKIKAVL